MSFFSCSYPKEKTGSQTFRQYSHLAPNNFNCKKWGKKWVPYSANYSPLGITTFEREFAKALNITIWMLMAKCWLRSCRSKNARTLTLDNSCRKLLMSSACLVAQLCPTLCDPMDRSPPGSSVHAILQARILEWVAISFSICAAKAAITEWAGDGSDGCIQLTFQRKVACVKISDVFYMFRCFCSFIAAIPEFLKNPNLAP